MHHFVTIHDARTGQDLDEVGVECRHRNLRYQAMITWGSITKMGHGDSEDEAVRAAFSAFRGAVGSNYEARLEPHSD